MSRRVTDRFIVAFRALAVACGLLGFALAGLGADAARGASLDLPPEARPIAVTGLHNVFSIGPSLFSGSSPDDEAAFASLAKLGVKHILSVDGSRPKVDLAHKYGMAYIHIPHGYDGINSNTAARIVKAARTADGPLYVHCHHGLHRGPVAAAVICMANLGWTPGQGEAWLKTAGTGSNYVGLYETVRRFRGPTAAQLSALPAKFPELVTPAGLVEAMVAIDERWGHLMTIRKAGYQTPEGSPDLQPAHEATMLWEHYREMQRLPEARQKGEDFLQRAKAAETAAQAAEKLLREFAANPQPELRAPLDTSFDALARGCASCHRAHRDLAGLPPR